MEENINVNSADAIFIPSDIKGERTDYTSFKRGFVRTVPANCVLVRKNRFTGRIHTVNEKEKPDEYTGDTITKYGRFRTGGLKFLVPFISESIFVPVIDRTIDYPKASYYTKDGIETYVDIALKVRIVDPENYLKYGRYQLDLLNVLTQNLLVEYVKKKNYNDLSTGRIDLKDFDPTIVKDVNGNIIQQLDQSAYEDFRKRYGIEVKSVQLKSIKPSEEVQKLMDDAAQAALRQEARRIELETKKIEAKREAEIAEIRGAGTAKEYKLVEQAKIDILQQMYSVLTDSNMSNSQKVSILQQMIAGKNGSYIHFGGNTGEGTGLESSISKGIVAGALASDKVKEQKNETNCEKMIHEIETLIKMGVIEPSEKLNNLIELLKHDQETIQYVNRLSAEQFRITVDYTLAPFRKEASPIRKKS